MVARFQADKAWLLVECESHVRQRCHGKSAGDQPLDREVVVGGVGDTWRESGGCACRDQMPPAAFASRHPALLPKLREAHLARRRLRVLAGDGDPDRVVHQIDLSQSGIRVGRGTSVGEADRDVDLAGS